MTNDDLTLTVALNRAEIALRVEAFDRPGPEGHHLRGLADALAAQLRIERTREQSAAEIEKARRRPRRKRRPVPPGAVGPRVTLPEVALA